MLQAACRPDDRIAIYRGNIGNSPVRAALLLTRNDVQGRYAYRVSTTDILLSGKLDPSGKNLLLTEFDASGHSKATFIGVFSDSDPNFANGSKLNCEVVIGKWNSGERTLDFRFSMDSLTYSSLDHLYQPAGADNDDAVNRGAAAFRAAVINNRRDAVAQMISYPVYTKVAGNRTKIANAVTLLAQYDAIFTAAYRASIATAIPRLMFARDQGVMLGSGEVWFDPKGRVIALNN